MQVHAGRVAAGHQHQIARLGLPLRELPGGEARKLDRVDAPPALRAEHAGLGEYRDTGLARPRARLTRGARVGDAGEVDAGLLQLERRADRPRRRR